MLRRTYPARMAAIAASAALILSLAQPASVSAASFHQYSHAWENTGGNYTGMQVTRIDRAVTGQPSTGCSAPISGSPVYQTQWFKLPGSGNYYELGTGHQCNDTYRYWFGGVSINGQWYLVGYLTGRVNGISHVFQIDRVSTGPGTYYYYYRVDGVTRWTSGPNSNVGHTADTGLESYCSTCNVTKYSNSSLRNLISGTWTPWAGQDGSQVNAPTMCGNWVGPQSWQAGQGTGC